jgi:hypothetical protein
MVIQAIAQRRTECDWVDLTKAIEVHLNFAIAICGLQSFIDTLFSGFFHTENPASFASHALTGCKSFAVLTREMTLRTGFLQSGQQLSRARFAGRRNSNRPPHTRQLPSAISSARHQISEPFVRTTSWILSRLGSSPRRQAHEK